MHGSMKALASVSHFPPPCRSLKKSLTTSAGGWAFLLHGTVVIFAFANLRLSAFTSSMSDA